MWAGDVFCKYFCQNKHHNATAITNINNTWGLLQPGHVDITLVILRDPVGDMAELEHNVSQSLTHLGRDYIDAILQTTFLNAFY